jgi:hypothetical protein
MSPRLGIFWQMSASTNRSSANVTVLRGTLAPLLMALGGSGPFLLRKPSTTRALFGSRILDNIIHQLVIF